MWIGRVDWDVVIGWVIVCVDRVCHPTCTDRIDPPLPPLLTAVAVATAMGLVASESHC